MKGDDKDDLSPEVIEYVRALMSGGVFRPLGADLEPEVELRDWEIMEVTGSWGKSHHVVGVQGGIGRVSSPIQSFDPAKREVVTRSGRIYRLLDVEERRFGELRNRESVRATWLRMNKCDGELDATEAYKAKMEKPQGSE